MSKKANKATKGTKAKKQKEPVLKDVKDLVLEVVAETGMDEKQAELAVKATFNAVMNINADGDKVQVKGFGTFEPRVRTARKGRNPQTGEEIEIAESIVPALSTGATYKKRVKEQAPERKEVKEPKSKAKQEADVDTQETKPKADKKDKTAKKNKKGSKKKK